MSAIAADEDSDEYGYVTDVKYEKRLRLTTTNPPDAYPAPAYPTPAYPAPAYAYHAKY